MIVARRDMCAIIAESLGVGPAGESAWSWVDNVYDAMAVAADRHRQGCAADVAILVDYLSPAELEVFSSLARLDQVRAIAVSASGQQGKLARAARQGAVETLMLSERAPLSGSLGWAAAGEVAAGSSYAPRAQAPEGVERAERAGGGQLGRAEKARSKAEPALMNLAAEAVRSARQSRQDKQENKDEPGSQAKPVVSASEKQESVKESGPLLSDDELSALLD